MEARLFHLAMALLDELKSQFILTNQVTREATRLAALNLLLSIRFGSKDNSKSLELPVFENLSFGAEKSGLNQEEVLELTNAVFHRFDTTKWTSHVNGLAIRDFVDLLSYTHSLSCFALPNGQDEHTPRRAVGAFYTAKDVTDYIVELTVSPLLPSIGKRIQLGNRGLPRIIDPACGTGAFLISTAELFKRRFGNELEAPDLCEQTRKALYGIDLDAGALEIAKVSVELIMQPSSPQIKERNSGPELRRGNSLVSMKGWDGQSSHNHFFADSSSRFPLEWKCEFPTILGKYGSGFDAVVMNPPYQRLKPNLAEFMRDRLLKGNRTIHLAEYDNRKEIIAEDVKYYRKSGEYKFGNRYTIDTYRLFIERALQITRYRGRIGFIVPSSLLGDLSAMKLRECLLSGNQIELVREFSEGNSLFPEVTQSVCILVAEKGGSTAKINACFGLQDIDGARSNAGFTIHGKEITRFAGNSKVIPRVSKTGWKIFDRIHRFPSVSSFDWLSNRRGELDLTLDRKFITEGSSGNRLVRGSHISRYMLLGQPKTKPESVEFEAFMESLRGSPKARHIVNWRIACQQVSNRLQHWRLKFALVPPKSILANSCNYIAINENKNQDYLHYLLAVLNSHLLNWRFEVSNTNNHVSNHELSRLPIPDPQAMTAAEKESVRTIVKLAKKRITGDEEVEPVLEASVLSLFGLTRTESSRVLNFRGVNDFQRKNILKHLG
ncbi:MAG: hypothetical protein EAX95_09330 [Candidatus Thorarchaeota archaeon]|nr:hypothetical protein [Candidatus Thorarchaeota archaeon]